MRSNSKMRALLDRVGGTSPAHESLPPGLQKILELGWAPQPTGAFVLRMWEPTAQRTAVDRLAKTLSEYEWFINGLHVEDFVQPGRRRRSRAEHEALVPPAIAFARAGIAAARRDYGRDCVALVMASDARSGVTVRFWQRRDGTESLESQEMLDASPLEAAIVDVSDLSPADANPL